jgi:hypothetical protein
MKLREQPPLGAFPRPDLVPYIAKWSTERTPSLRMVVKRGRIAYADEKPYDRDADGVLWTRVPSLPGKGRPEFGKVHALRQRRAMSEVLCQVCGKSADRAANGVLWLISEDPNDPDAWRTDVLTTHPPLCVPCAMTSVGACPHLRKQYVALRVRAFHVAGVRGALYQPGYPSPVAVDVAGVAYGDPNIRWMRAGQLIMRLTDFEVVELEAQAAAPG